MVLGAPAADVAGELARPLAADLLRAAPEQPRGLGVDHLVEAVVGIHAVDDEQVVARLLEDRLHALLRVAQLLHHVLATLGVAPQPRQRARQQQHDAAGERDRERGGDPGDGA